MSWGRGVGHSLNDAGLGAQGLGGVRVLGHRELGSQEKHKGARPLAVSLPLGLSPSL